MTDRGLTSDQVTALRARYGWNEVEEEKRVALIEFLKKFWGPSAWMIELIAAVSIFLGKRADFGIALGLLIANATISFFEERRAETTVKLLKKRLQIFARVLRDKQWNRVPARDLVPTDVIRVRLGDVVPADLKIIEGNVLVDQSILTGESGDIAKSIGDTAYSGSLVRRGEASGEIVATGVKTYFGRTIELVQSARPRLHIEEIVTKLVRVLFLVIGTLVAVTIALSYSSGLPLAEIVPLSLVLLMSAVPVALPVMFTVSTAIAAKKLGAKGVLVTRLSAAEDAATMDTLFVDKTGTITQNRLSVGGVFPVSGATENDVLQFAALASDAKAPDAIDGATLEACKARGIPLSEPIEFTPFSPETRRSEAEVLENELKIIATKGAVTETLHWAGADIETANSSLDCIEREARRGFRSIAVARSLPDGGRRFLGTISLQDPPRKDSRDLIIELRRHGLRVIMLTGDAKPVAQEVAKEVGLGEIAVWRGDSQVDWKKISGLAQVFPETKFRVIEEAQSEGHVTGMTGDGVNDAPALKKAEVGIAVSSATDSAKSAASIVLTTEGLSGIVDLVENGRAVYQRILTWVINKISRTVLKSGFVVAAYLIYGEFVISAFAMILLVFMTDFAKVLLSTDNVRPSGKPDTWNIRPLIGLGVYLGILMVIESLFIFWIELRMGGAAVRSRTTHTLSFLILLFMAVFSILSVRERRRFWSSSPSLWLFIALGFELAVGIYIGLFGFVNLPAIGSLRTLSALGFCAGLSLVVNDFVKHGVLAAKWEPRLKVSGEKGGTCRLEAKAHQVCEDISKANL